MQLQKCIMALAALIAWVQCAQVAALYSINDCADSSFTNESSGGSPTIADCQQIAVNIANGGSWSVTTGQHQLVQYGTCAFGITVPGGWIAYVGNQDIIDLINSSISMFSWNGLVGAKGEMPCQGDNAVIGEVEVEWGIYHN